MKPQLKIDWATHEAAKYACENWHYSKCLPVGKLVKIGAWEDGKFIGVVLFGRGASPQLGKPYKLNQDECVELVRIGLSKHSTTVSRIASLAIKFLRRSNPKLRLIVSFADQSQGHHGGIYQAGNWIYTGEGTAKPRLILPDGTTRHNRLYQGVNKAAIPIGAYWSKPEAKHRYLMPLDDEIRKRILPLAKPYPKRAKDQALENPSSLGGETPTRTLHTSGDG